MNIEQIFIQQKSENGSLKMQEFKMQFDIVQTLDKI